jgi:trehalose 6-phosphate synthase
MRAMRRHLFRNDLDHWATSFFDSLRGGARGRASDPAAERDADRAARRGQPGAQG